MKKILATSVLVSNAIIFVAQTNPAITSWLQNTTVKGRHYVSGNSTPINDTYTANVQSVKYSTTSELFLISSILYFFNCFVNLLLNHSNYISCDLNRSFFYDYS